MLRVGALEARGVLRDPEDGHDAEHERAKLLPFVLLQLHGVSDKSDSNNERKAKGASLFLPDPPTPRG